MSCPPAVWSTELEAWYCQLGVNQPSAAVIIIAVAADSAGEGPQWVSL